MNDTDNMATVVAHLRKKQPSLSEDEALIIAKRLLALYVAIIGKPPHDDEESDELQPVA
jgi:hypothetical protein